jgi:hypothetical protein
VLQSFSVVLGLDRYVRVEERFDNFSESLAAVSEESEFV